MNFRAAQRFIAHAQRLFPLARDQLSSLCETDPAHYLFHFRRLQKCLFVSNFRDLSSRKINYTASDCKRIKFNVKKS